MRIIGGRLKGRRLAGPRGPGVRPTSDGLRETLYNVLRDRIQGARVIDVFAGTGAVGLEAISRGAAHATFVESDRRAVSTLRSNIAGCGIASEGRVIAESARGLAVRHPELTTFDIVFLDPPYDFADLEVVLSEAADITNPSGLLILEHARRRAVPETAGPLMRRRTIVAGDSALTFYERPADTIEQAAP